MWYLDDEDLEKEQLKEDLEFNTFASNKTQQTQQQSLPLPPPSQPKVQHPTPQPPQSTVQPHLPLQVQNLRPENQQQQTQTQQQQQQQQHQSSQQAHYPQILSLPTPHPTKMSTVDEELADQMEFDEESGMAPREEYKKTSDKIEMELDGDFQFNLEMEAPELKPTTIPLFLEKNTKDEFLEDKKYVANFLDSVTCYDAMPVSGKMVVLDTNLPVKAGFQALVENDIKSAPLWDSEVLDYVGMITVTDFIDVLTHYYNRHVLENKAIQRINQTPIKVWRDVLASTRPPSLIHLKPEDSILKASRTLLKFQIHRLPIIDSNEQNTILYIITHTRILKYLVANLPDKPHVVASTIGKLGLGSHKHVVTIKETTPLITVLNVLGERKISAVPIVDDHDQLVDIYCKTDVAALATYSTIHDKFTKPIKEILTLQKAQVGRDRVLCTCSLSDTLERVMEQLFTNRVRRAVILDHDKKVQGIISMSDILKFFLSFEDPQGGGHHRRNSSLSGVPLHT